MKESWTQSTAMLPEAPSKSLRVLKSKTGTTGARGWKDARKTVYTGIQVRERV